MDETMNPLYILGWPLGYVMEWIYKLIPNYGWDIILFTLLITLVKIPLQINQQKSMARMSPTSLWSPTSRRSTATSPTSSRKS